MTAFVTLNRTDSSPGVTLRKCLSFTYTQERYSCASVFKGRFLVEGEVGDILRVEAGMDGRTLLRGFPARAAYTKSDGRCELEIEAVSYAALLDENYIQPGMYPRVSLNSLIFELIRLEDVTCQESASTINYISVTDHTSMWDSIGILCLRQFGVLPYVAHGNVVRFSTEGGYRVIAPTRILETSFSLNTTRLVSDIHMQDAQGNYGVHQLHSEYPLERGILRHKQIAYDKAWLADTELGLRQRMGFTQRAAKAYSVTYLGYSGEGLYDRIHVEDSYPALAPGKIAAMTVQGDHDGVRTRVSVYEDMFANLNT